MSVLNFFFHINIIRYFVALFFPQKLVLRISAALTQELNMKFY